MSGFAVNTSSASRPPRQAPDPSLNRSAKSDVLDDRCLEIWPSVKCLYLPLDLKVGAAIHAAALSTSLA